MIKFLIRLALVYWLEQRFGFLYRGIVEIAIIEGEPCIVSDVRYKKLGKPPAGRSMWNIRLKEGQSA